MTAAPTLLPDFPVPTVDAVVQAILCGLDGAALSDESTLTADDVHTDPAQVPEGVVPYLGIRGVSFTSRNFPYDHLITLSVDAFLRIRQAGGQDRFATARHLLDDVFLAVEAIDGLPVNRKGDVVPLSPATPYLFRDGLLTLLATRGGPYLTAGRYVEQSGSPFAHVDLTLSVLFLRHVDTRPKPKGRTAAIGLRAVDPLRRQVTDGDDYSAYAVIPLTDYRGFGRYQDPPPPGGLPFPYLPGYDPAKELIRIEVTPGAVALAVAGTRQMTATGVYADLSTSGVPLAGVTWASSSPAIATVSSTGLVTGVAPGTTNVTSARDGITSAAVIVTVT